jgi:hypothetical protein
MLTISRRPGKLVGDDAIGAKLVAFTFDHRRARLGYRESLTLCRPDRNRADEPGATTLSFAPLATNGAIPAWSAGRLIGMTDPPDMRPTDRTGTA